MVFRVCIFCCSPRRARRRSRIRRGRGGAAAAGGGGRLARRVALRAARHVRRVRREAAAAHQLLAQLSASATRYVYTSVTYSYSVRGQRAHVLRTFNSLPPDRLAEIEQNRTATALPPAPSRPLGSPVQSRADQSRPAHTERSTL